MFLSAAFASPLAIAFDASPFAASYAPLAAYPSPYAGACPFSAAYGLAASASAVFAHPAFLF
jgi:hypothetical protein